LWVIKKQKLKEIGWVFGKFAKEKYLSVAIENYRT
jgi:hypothetical protein